MRKGRALIAVTVAALLAPGLWWRSEPRPMNPNVPVRFTRIVAEQPGAGELRTVGVWEIAADYRMHGGYSALISSGAGELLAASDAGGLMKVSQADEPPMEARFVRLAVAGETDKRDADIEALTEDGAGRLWVAYERSNAVERYDAELRQKARAVPAEMRNWDSNSGAEAFERLADGRFLALRERVFPNDTGRAKGVLFASDPSAGDARAVQFTFVPPERFRPVDAARLPDGRVLVLLRAIAGYIPPRFDSLIAVVDPAEMVEGAEVAPLRVLRLPASVPGENYEGLAVVPQGDGSVRLWLISDDNFSGLQRTLLVALDYRLTEKQRGARVAPRAP